MDLIALGIMDKGEVRLSAKGYYSADVLNAILDLFDDFLRNTAALELNDIEKYVRRLENIAILERLPANPLIKSFKFIKGQVDNLHKQFDSFKAISAAA